MSAVGLNLLDGLCISRCWGKSSARPTHVSQHAFSASASQEGTQTSALAQTCPLISALPNAIHANMEVILPGSRTGPIDEGTFSKLMAAGSISTNFGAVPDGRERGEVALLCVIGGLANDNGV